MPKVSILTTTFNAGDYLQIAVDSILNQSLKDIELIVVDNCSTDESIASLNDSDSRLRLIRLTSNIGRTRALQLALSEARGEYVAILDADDVAHPNRLKLQANLLDSRKDVALVGSTVRLLDAAGTITDERFGFFGEVTPDVIGERNVFINSSVMYRRKIALLAGGYRSEFQFAQDYDLFLRILTFSQAVVTATPLTDLRILSKSLTNQRNMRLVRAREEHVLFEKAPQILILTRHGARLNRRRQAIASIYLGVTLTRGRSPFSGFALVVRGISCDPTFSWIPYVVRRFFRDFSSLASSARTKRLR